MPKLRTGREYIFYKHYFLSSYENFPRSIYSLLLNAITYELKFLKLYNELNVILKKGNEFDIVLVLEFCFCNLNAFP